MNEVAKTVSGGWGTFKLGTYEFEWAMLVKILIILAVTILASTIVRVLMNRFIQRSSLYLKVDSTRLKFFRSALNALIYIMAIIAIIYVIPPFRAISMTLLASAGIFAAVLGFASQQAFSNIVSGVFVVVSRPFRVGDVIRIGRDTTTTNELLGTVEDITLRHTVIRDFHNRRIIIPNSVINMEVITNNNIVDERVRRLINVTISYEADVDRAIAIVQEEARKHPFFIDGRSAQDIRMGEDDVMVRVVELNETGVKLRAYVWALNFDQGWELHCDLSLAILKRFKKEGIELAYPHRVLIDKTPSKK